MHAPHVICVCISWPGVMGSMEGFAWFCAIYKIFYINYLGALEQKFSIYQTKEKIVGYEQFPHWCPFFISITVFWQLYCFDLEVLWVKQKEEEVGREVNWGKKTIPMLSEVGKLRNRCQKDYLNLCNSILCEENMFFFSYYIEINKIMGEGQLQLEMGQLSQDRGQVATAVLSQNLSDLMFVNTRSSSR